MKTKILKTIYSIDAALPNGESPLPHFRDREHDKEVHFHSTVPKEFFRNAGKRTGRRILPYTLQDRYRKNIQHKDLDAIILENDHLKATFLPSLGGRLHSLYSKDEQRELLYCNKKLTVANLSIRDAWFAGGIEWNIGQYGHAFTTCDSVFFARIENPNGDDFLRMYEYEECHDLYWHIDFHLPSDSTLLYAKVSIHNTTEKEHGLYYWTNVALPLTKETKTYASNKNVLYIDPYAGFGNKAFGYAQIPHIPILPNKDASMPENFPYSSEYFFTCNNDRQPWEVILQKEGKGFFDTSTQKLGYRKMFCWGSQNGGKNWQKFLSPTGEEYIEAQAGLAPTQLHGETIAKKSSVSWTQVFGAINYGESTETWETVQKNLDTIIAERIDNKKLKELDKELTELCTIEPVTLLFEGSGRGHLNEILSGKSAPKGFLFPKKSLSKKDKIWKHFLENGWFLESDYASISFHVSEKWQRALENSIKCCKTLHNRHITHYLLGICAFENGQEEKAHYHWLKALEICPSAFPARNLAQLELSKKNIKTAIDWYRKALSLPDFSFDYGIYEEYIHLLAINKKWTQIYSLLTKTPDEWIEKSDRLAFDIGLAAAKNGDVKTAEKMIHRNFANIREGESPIDDLFFELFMLKNGSKATSLPLEYDFHVEPEDA